MGVGGVNDGGDGGTMLYAQACKQDKYIYEQVHRRRGDGNVWSEERERGVGLGGRL